MARLGLTNNEIVVFMDNKRDAAEESPGYIRLNDNYAKLWRAYNGIFKDKTPKTFQARVYVRAIFTLVEAARTQIRSQIFRSNDLFLVRPRKSDPQSEFRAENMRKLINYYSKVNPFQEKLLDSLNFVLKFGNAPAFVGWDFKVNRSRKRTFKEDPVFGAITEGEETEQDIVERDYPIIEPYDPRDVLWDPQARWVDEAGHVILVFETTMQQLRAEEKEKEWINLDEAEKVMRTGRISRSTDARRGQNDGDYFGVDTDRTIVDVDREQLVLDDYWGIVDHKSSAQDDVLWNLTKIRDTNTVIRVRQTPFSHNKIPVVNGNIIPTENTLYSTGMVETLLDEQHMANFLLNTRLDGIAHFFNPRLLHWKGAFRDKSALARNMPGQLLEVNKGLDLDRAVKPLQVPDLGANSFRQTFELVNQLMERTAAISPTSLGVINRVQRTATEVGQAAAGSAARSSDQIFVFTHTFLLPAFRQMVQLIQDNLVSPLSVPILGDRTSLPIPPWAIQGEFEINVNAVNEINRETISQVLTNEIAALSPFAQAGVLDPIPILRAIFKNNPLFDNFDIDKIIVKPEFQQAIAAAGQESQGRASVSGSRNVPGVATRQPAPVGGTRG